MIQENSQTIRKVKATVAGAGVAGAIVVVLVWIANMYQIEVPEEVQAAFVILLPALFGWIAGYWTPPAETDNIVYK